MTLEFIYQLAIALVVGGAVYGGIRSDIKSIHEKISVAHRTATRAHDRIDRHLESKGEK